MTMNRAGWTFAALSIMVLPLLCVACGGSTATQNVQNTATPTPTSSPAETPQATAQAGPTSKVVSIDWGSNNNAQADYRATFQVTDVTASDGDYGTQIAIQAHITNTGAVHSTYDADVVNTDGSPITGDYNMVRGNSTFMPEPGSAQFAFDLQPGQSGDAIAQIQLDDKSHASFPSNWRIEFNPTDTDVTSRRTYLFRFTTFWHGPFNAEQAQ